MSKKTLNVRSNNLSLKKPVIGELFKVEKEAREYAEDIIATVREPLIVLDVELKVILVNKSFCQIFKVSPEETVGRFIYDLGNRQWNIPKLRQLLEDILPNSTEFENFEVKHNFETIGQKTMLLNARRIPRPPKKPKIILLAIEDISERKRIEEKLEESEDRFRSVFMGSRDAIMILEPPTWKFTSENRATTEMFKVKNKTDFLSFDPWGLSPKRQPDGRLSSKKAKEMIGIAMRKGFYLFEWVHKRTNGEEFYADVLLSRIKVGRKTFLQALVRDITERKKMEQQIEKAILASIGDAVMACDKDGKIILFNHVASKISGFTPKEAIGHNYKQIIRLVDEDTNKPRKDFIAKVIYENKVASLANHMMIVRKDGTKVPVADSAAPILDLSGKVSGCVVAFRDVTKEHQIKKMKDEFLSVASHELRTPMTAIKGFLDMIIKEQVGKIPTAKMRDYLQFAYMGNERMIKLVNDLLNVSRIEAGRMKFDLADTQIEEIIEKSVVELSKISHPKGLYIKYKKSRKPLPPVVAAADKIQMVLTDIVGNALKFTAKGGVKIWTETDKKQITVHIQDTGAGIAKEEQGKLFQKFSQIDTTISGSIKGTGLGLYISKMIVEKLDGRIWCQSEGKGKGSTFSFSLPVKGSSASKEAVKVIQKEVREQPV